MKSKTATEESLVLDLQALGIRHGEGLFIHAAMRPIGPVAGGPGTLIRAMRHCLGTGGLIGMPAFSTDATVAGQSECDGSGDGDLAALERRVPGFDPRRSSALGMGILAETFRTWPGTLRSTHPVVSICLNGPDAAPLLDPHPLAWASGPGTPLGRLAMRPGTKVLLIGVGWNRCSALHTAETLAPHRRAKTRRFKSGPSDDAWIETPDAADDLGRLFPDAGAAFEATGAVRTGKLGRASCRICDLAVLVGFASRWIDAANRASGDRR